MSVTEKALAVCLLLLTCLGVKACRDRDVRLRLEGEVADLRADADSISTDAVARVADAEQRALLAEAVIEVEAEKRARAERQVRVLIREQEAAGDSVVVAALTGDTAAVRGRVENLQALHEREREEWGAVVRSQDLVIWELRALDSARVDAIRGLEAALAAKEAVIAAMPQPPGWLSRNAWWISAGAGLYVGWNARGSVVRDDAAPRPVAEDHLDLARSDAVLRDHLLH